MCFVAVWLLILGMIFLVARIRNGRNDKTGDGTGTGSESQSTQDVAQHGGDTPSSGDISVGVTTEPTGTTEPPPVTSTTLSL